MKGLKETLKEALAEMEAEKESKTVVISAATQGRVECLFRLNGLTTEEGAFHGSTPAISFLPFQWNERSESEGTPDARNHLEEELIKFGAKFGRGFFKLVDCHRNKHLLNVEDSKIGKISGGSDLVVVPFKTALRGLSQLISVLFELKTDSAGTLENFVPQGGCELLAARILSYQPKVLAVVTDLCSGAIVLQFDYDRSYRSFKVIETFCTLSEMATLVCQFLTDAAVPDVSFRPVDSDPRDEEAIIFKKTKMCNDQGIAMEHFMEMVDDPDTTPEERYHLARQLFMSSDVERMPTLLSLPYPMMYT